MAGGGWVVVVGGWVVGGSASVVVGGGGASDVSSGGGGVSVTVTGGGGACWVTVRVSRRVELLVLGRGGSRVSATARCYLDLRESGACCTNPAGADKVGSYLRNSISLQAERQLSR